MFGLVLTLASFNPMAAEGADGPPWKPDYSSPTATVLTLCMAQNLPEGRKEIMARAYFSGHLLPEEWFTQNRAMCRVVKSEPLAEEDPRAGLPGEQLVVLEEWDPGKGDMETNIYRRWFALRQVGEEWKITEWGDVNSEEDPSDAVGQLPGGSGTTREEK